MRSAIAGLLVTCLLAVTPAFASATEALGSPVKVEGVDVEPVERLEPGAVLRFTVFGSRGASAMLQITGVRFPLELREIHPGIYEGQYVLSGQDRVEPGAPVKATLRRDGLEAWALLEEPLVSRGVAPLATPRPRADDHEAPRIAAPTPRVIAEAKAGDARSPTAEEARQAQVLPARRAATPPAEFWLARPAEGPARRAIACAGCAVVESVRRVEPVGSNGLAGALVGGLAGAVIAGRAGNAPERHLAQVAGFLGGAWLGREIERRSTLGAVRYDVWLRLPNGSTQFLSYATPPPYRPGDIILLRR
ncbi:MAG: hypothetical protein ACJ8G7_24315 [Rhizobacter sp.]